MSWYLSDQAQVADNKRVTTGVWAAIGKLVDLLCEWHVQRAKLEWRYLLGGRQWMIVLIRERAGAGR